MNNYSISEISKIVIHSIGNKLNGEGIILSKKNSSYNVDIKGILISYFISSFKSNEYFSFHHASDLNLNEVFTYASKIFDQPNTIYEQSINIAKHLYECSTHPKIKGGEFCTVYFKNCIFEGKEVDAIGLFKSENKDFFLKLERTEDCYRIDGDKGINANKLDKGCLIFNTNRNKGYTIAIVDTVSKGEDAIYWVDDFLHVAQRQDDFHKTQNVLLLCKQFITKELPNEFEVSKTDQVDLLNKSIQFFKDKDSFEIEEFANTVIEQPEIIKSFYKYKTSYQEDLEIKIPNSFTISDHAVKKQTRIFKSILKLDKNFHIYIHGNRDLIEQGVERDGRKFYKIYFDQEH